ncbi:MAG: hypothetical protein AB7I27_12860 [Bacteriovoracaceae bacterium]
MNKFSVFVIAALLLNISIPQTLHAKKIKKNKSEYSHSKSLKKLKIKKQKKIRKR